MTTITRIPLSPGNKRFSIALGGTTYRMRVLWDDETNGGYVLDIGDETGAPILLGVPLVTGVDLLVQYPHLNFGGSLFVTTDRDTGDLPTYDGLGVTSQLTFVAKN